MGGGGEGLGGLDAGVTVAVADLSVCVTMRHAHGDAPNFIAWPAAMLLGEQDGLPVNRRR